MTSVYGPLVINLDKRKDRLEQAIKEFGRLNFEIIRFPATYIESDPALACIDSHCRALEQFLETKHDILFICEDDAEFKCCRGDIDHYLIEFACAPANVMCFGFYAANVKHFSPFYNVSNDIQNRVAYVVKRDAAKELVQIWRKLYMLLISKEHIRNPNNWYKTAYDSLPIINKAKDIYRGDQAWKICQQTLRFVLPKKNMIVQRESYSDIEKAVVNYGN